MGSKVMRAIKSSLRDIQDFLAIGLLIRIPKLPMTKLIPIRVPVGPRVWPHRSTAVGSSERIVLFKLS